MQDKPPISVASSEIRSDFTVCPSPFYFHPLIMQPVWIIDDDRSIRWVFEKALAREDIAF